MAQGDTTFLTSDSTLVQIKRGNETILIVNDKEDKQTSAETNWTTTLWIPLIIVIVGAGISFLVNRNKTKSEISKLDLDASKITEEIETIKEERGKILNEKIKLHEEVDKMRAETEMLRKSFQPYVLSTLQETQKEILTAKLAALKTLVNLSKGYYTYDTQYYFGETILNDEYDYYQTVYMKFGKSGHGDFQNFIADYEYIFPKAVIDEFIPIKAAIQKLYESNKRSDSVMQLELTDGDYERLKSLPEQFEKAIQAIRKDLHLDNTFIHDFLELNNIKK